MSKDTVGDRLAPALRQEGSALAAAASAKRIDAQAAPNAVDDIKKKSVAQAIKNQEAVAVPQGSCKQVLWFSFFFDGTGNNLDADLDTKKHSNVAKLFRAHQGTENIGGRLGAAAPTTGIYRIYVPGVGTYFKEIGDSGGMMGGGFGRYGDQRIEWALKEMNKLMDRHIRLAQSPSNQIIEINVAAFGFSRGAALARAFIHDLLTDHCEKRLDKTWRFKRARCRLRVRFLGLFDTVASSGLAASTNTVSFVDAATGGVKSHMWVRRHLYANTRPDVLAFAEHGKAGADPNPGIWDGHKAFGNRMFINPMVENVRHFVAAHEYRNSFPLDSVSYLTDTGTYYKPAHFHEYVYPGVHSDVGGSYRPGEGGRNNNGATKLGLIPLRSMYAFAHAAHVPLRSYSAFEESSKTDFAILPEVMEDFNYYSSKVGAKGNTLGGLFNAHMSLYYQWRFYDIRRKMNKFTASNDAIARNAKVFDKDRENWEKGIKPLQDNYDRLRKISTGKAIMLSQMPTYMALTEDGRRQLAAQRVELEKAVAAEKAAYDKLMPLKAQQAALPAELNLITTTNIYDQQLIDDTESIIGWLKMPTLISITRGFKLNRASLRPHYKALVEAYENEFELKKGLRDKRLIAFFDMYVHDSLSAFAKDGTLPSDPRVIYTGGDEKLPYANNDSGPEKVEEPETRMA